MLLPLISIARSPGRPGHIGPRTFAIVTSIAGSGALRTALAALILHLAHLFTSDRRMLPPPRSLSVNFTCSFLFREVLPEVWLEFVGLKEAWGPPQFQEKRSRSEKAILGALGEFRGILGAALGIGNSILGIRKFHSRNGLSRLDQYETHNSRSNSRSDSRNCREPTRKISFAPAFSERFFKNWGGPRAVGPTN